jgi:hypothetical protein
MNETEMEEAGKKSENICWTDVEDVEMENQIEALTLVVAYFRGRKDCGILFSALYGELESLRRMYFARHGEN